MCDGANIFMSGTWNKKDKAQQDEIDRKVEEYRKRQEKDSSEIKR